MLCLRRFQLALLLSSLALLSACAVGEPQSSAATLRARAQSELDSLRATATVRRARMQTTLDYVGTRVGQADAAANFLFNNFSELGTATDFIATSISQIEAGPNGATAPAPTQAAQPEALSLVTPIAPPSPVPIASPTSDASPAPGATDSGPRLENIVLASGVDSSGCASNREPRFTPASSEIYVVLKAYNIPPGAVFSASWRHPSGESKQFDYQPNYVNNGDCIWFYIDQTDLSFTVGAWSVEIRVDGNALAPPLEFQIAAA